jgi:hypothetical protein
MRVAILEETFPADRSTDLRDHDCGETKKLERQHQYLLGPGPAVIDVHDETPHCGQC